MRSILLALLSASLVAANPGNAMPHPLIDPLGYYALGYQTRCGLLNDGTCTCDVQSCCDENRRQELLAMCRQSAPFCTPNESGNVEDHLPRRVGDDGHRRSSRTWLTRARALASPPPSASPPSLSPASSSPFAPRRHAPAACAARRPDALRRPDSPTRSARRPLPSSPAGHSAPSPRAAPYRPEIPSPSSAVSSCVRLPFPNCIKV